MAIFDALTFNPQGYGGQGGGLLDLLRSFQMQQQMQPSAGFADQPTRTVPVGNYQMPQFGNQDPAALPPNAQPTQGQLPANAAPPQQLPPAFGQPSEGGSFSAGLQNFAAAPGLISKLTGLAQGLSTGQRTDPQGIAQQNLRAQYEALVPIMGPKKAMLSVMNPEAGKAFLAEITDKPTFGVIGKDDFGNEKYGFIHPTKEKVTPASVPGAPAASAPLTVTGPDGKQIPIPAGVDPKKFRADVTSATADAATGKKTEVQSKSEKFGNKMETAESQMRFLEGQGTQQLNRTLESVPFGNYAQSESYQKYKQARDNFITALLRDESGAAIGTQEFNRYERELFPQPGDSKGVIEQKRQARKVAIEAMKKSAGPGYKSPETVEAPEQATVERSAVEAEMKRRGLIK